MNCICVADESDHSWISGPAGPPLLVGFDLVGMDEKLLWGNCWQGLKRCRWPALWEFRKEGGEGGWI